ncbi:MAG: S41 family peptidase [Mangrovibacterium sp.]
MNKKTSIVLPLIIAVAIVLGMFIGRALTYRSGSAILNDLRKYSSANKIDAVLQLISSSYVDTIDARKLQEDIIPVFLEKLDPHSAYIPAKDMREISQEMSGNFGGIGVQFSIQSDTVRVIDVISGGPSQKLGILPGDRITIVDDSLIAGVGVENETVMNLLRGEKGTKVKVGVERKNINDVIWFDITRGEIPLYSVDVNFMVDDTTGYIKVSRFAEKTHREFVDACENVISQGATQFIIDLRGNPGGYLTAVIRMVNEFLPKDAMIVYTEGRARARRESRADGSGRFLNQRVVVLIDEYSASASEIFSGALQDNDRAVIVGRRSFGKGLVQEQVPFTDGSALRLTVARYYIPSGRCIQKPYAEGETEYRMDIFNRMAHGELSQVDSIHFSDSLRYETLNKRVVYGGGGVMPDLFVPIDTTGYSDYFSQVIQKGLTYRFAIDYVDANRKEMQQFTTAQEIERYLKKEQILNRFVEYARQEDVPRSTQGLKESGEIIERQVMAYIARNMIGEVGFYPIIQEMDNVMHEAEHLLSNENAYEDYLLNVSTDEE